MLYQNTRQKPENGTYQTIGIDEALNAIKTLNDVALKIWIYGMIYIDPKEPFTLYNETLENKLKVSDRRIKEGLKILRDLGFIVHSSGTKANFYCVPHVELVNDIRNHSKRATSFEVHKPNKWAGRFGMIVREDAEKAFIDLKQTSFKLWLYLTLNLRIEINDDELANILEVSQKSIRSARKELIDKNYLYNNNFYPNKRDEEKELIAAQWLEFEKMAWEKSFP